MNIFLVLEIVPTLEPNLDNYVRALCVPNTLIEHSLCIYATEECVWQNEIMIEVTIYTFTIHKVLVFS